MDIKLIALDLDRTTLNADGTVSQANKEALLYAMSKGVHVCIASGRAFDTLPKSVLDIPGIEYAITSNGAAIYRIKDKMCLKSFIMTAESVDLIMQLTKDMPVTYEAFIKGKAYAGAEYINNPVKYGATPQAINYVQTTRTLVLDIREFINIHRCELDSMDIIVNDASLKKQIQDLISDSTDDVYMTSSIKQLLEISYKDAGKHSGVKYLADSLGINRDNIAAFGDADNDLDMIEYAGVGIAMENATAILKEKADYVTRHHNEDGVAYAIRNYLNI